MRKKIVFAALFIALLLAGSTALAGDIPEGIMAGSQQALFIGRILTVGKDTIAIAPLTVMMGQVNGKTVEVPRFKAYYGNSGSPKKQDYIVVRLLTGTTLDETWVFKCTSGNYKTLKLYGPQYDMVKRYQKYINDGAYFEAQKELDAKPSAPPAPPTTAPTPLPSSAASATPVVTQAPASPSPAASFSAPPQPSPAAVLASAPAPGKPLATTLLVLSANALAIIALLLIFFTRKRARQD